MNRILSTVILSLTLFIASAQEPLIKVIEHGLTLSCSQSLLLAKTLEYQEDKLPRSFIDNQLITSDYSWWCSGFFPGVLWQLYSDKKDAELLRYAKLYTDRIEPAKSLTSTHDLGFMINCSFGQGYTQTQDDRYLEIIKEGSNSLLGRYDANIGVIKSWDVIPEWEYPVIIDNMMNLEMLCYTSRITNDSQYQNAAESHANKTIAYHFREDYSTYHVVSYDPETGLPHFKGTNQGYADESTWARGEAWALYGYMMMYRETRLPAYLEQARHIADFIITHPRLPEDGIPYWDFDAPEIPNALRDASAAAIMASAFVQLSQLDTTSDASKWAQMAEKQIRTLSSSAYLANEGEQNGFILKHSVGKYPTKSEVDVPLTYADYYYIEALLRMKRSLKSKYDLNNDGTIDITDVTNLIDYIVNQ